MKRFKTKTGITSGKKGRFWTTNEGKREGEKKGQPKWREGIQLRQDTQVMTDQIQDLLATGIRHRLSGINTPDIRPMKRWIEVPHPEKPMTAEIDIIHIDTRSIQPWNVIPCPEISKMGGTGTLAEEVGSLPDITIQESWTAAVGGTKKSSYRFFVPPPWCFASYDQGAPPSSILLYTRPLRCPRISLPVSSQNYEDMKYDQDMKISRITHQDTKIPQLRAA